MCLMEVYKDLIKLKKVNPEQALIQEFRRRWGGE